jgi:hypothetical protein
MYAPAEELSWYKAQLQNHSKEMQELYEHLKKNSNDILLKSIKDGKCDERAGNNEKRTPKRKSRHKTAEK